MRVPSLEPSRKKRKLLLRNDEDIFQSIKNGRATPGTLIALQARIVAESGYKQVHGVLGKMIKETDNVH